MRARYVSEADLKTLLDPGSPAWGRGGAEVLKLEGTPLELQPSAQIQAAWKGRKIGAVDGVRVAVVHDGRMLAFHLEWRDPTENAALADTDQFPDAAAVLLPSAPNAPVLTMGAPSLAVNAWYWRADDAQGRQVVAEGLGTSRTTGVEQLRCRGVWQDGRWRVVIARALRVESAEPVTQLEAGQTTGCCVVVWDGGSGERGGIKSFTGPLWQELRIDALPTARR
jgi:DMSO reductase family type II enzyme heme b subunit